MIQNYIKPPTPQASQQARSTHPLFRQPTFHPQDSIPSFPQTPIQTPSSLTSTHRLLVPPNPELSCLVLEKLELLDALGLAPPQPELPSPLLFPKYPPVFPHPWFLVWFCLLPARYPAAAPPRVPVQKPGRQPSWAAAGAARGLEREALDCGGGAEVYGGGGSSPPGLHPPPPPPPPPQGKPLPPAWRLVPLSQSLRKAEYTMNPTTVMNKLQKIIAGQLI